MSTHVRAKKMGDGTKKWFLWTGNDSGERYKHYPQCDDFHRSDFYDVLRKELGLTTRHGRHDIVQVLLRKTWDGEKWVDDPPR